MVVAKGAAAAAVEEGVILEVMVVLLGVQSSQTSRSVCMLSSRIPLPFSPLTMNLAGFLFSFTFFFLLF